MDVLDIVRVAVRFGHALAAVVWVGGSLFYALALTPAFDRIGRTRERNELLSAIGQEFRQLVRLAIVVFLFSGAILTFDRLSQPRVTALYVGVLAVKVALSLWMFWLARRLEYSAPPRADRMDSTESNAEAVAPPVHRRWPRPQTLVLALGLAVYLLAVVLKVIFENTLAA